MVHLSLPLLICSCMNGSLVTTIAYVFMYFYFLVVFSGSEVGVGADCCEALRELRKGAGTLCQSQGSRTGELLPGEPSSPT